MQAERGMHQQMKENKKGLTEPSARHGRLEWLTSNPYRSQCVNNQQVIKTTNKLKYQLEEI